MVIDILVIAVLLFCLYTGWRKGFLLSLLGVVRFVLAYGLAYVAGRYIGGWLAEIAHRPRIVTIPVLAGFTFVIITFIFHVVMTHIRDERRDRQKQEGFTLPWYSSMGGSGINFCVAVLSLVFLFWLGDLLAVGINGRSMPGANRSAFGRFARRAVYEIVNLAVSRNGRESQAAATARVISNPARGMQHLENVVASDSMQQLASDPQFVDDLLSGDPVRIEQNASLQRLFNDRATLVELRELGVVWENDNKAELCGRLARFGSNEEIQTSIDRLKAKNLLSADRITDLIRDPDFDVIIRELTK
ncbi:MAG: CvpA family protein [Pontiella sp.]|nr:CvpA family protein [Pontiella sp.]